MTNWVLLLIAVVAVAGWVMWFLSEPRYPQMADFIKLKKHYDPHEMFQSDWYRHYRHMFAGAG